MNRQSFNTNTPNGKKHFQNLLNTLLDYNSDKDENYYNDIHIYQEDSLVIIEWDEVPYSHEWGGEFKYVDEDEVIMKHIQFPDGHYEYIFPEDIEGTLKEWHSKNPGWIKNKLGMWFNKFQLKKEKII